MTSIFFEDEFYDDITLDDSDELLLRELDRRDGIYSFIFHEIDIGPIATTTPTPTPTPTSTSTPPPATITHHDFNENDDDDDTGTFIKNCFSLNNQVTVFITEPFIEPEETFDENGILNINDEIYVINAASNIESTTSVSTVTSLSLTSAFSTLTTTFTSATTSTLTLTSSPTSLLMEMPNDHNRHLLSNNQPLKFLENHLMDDKLSNQCTSQPYQSESTTAATTSTMYEYPNISDYMTPGKFRLRVPVPGFSHITTPLVRNRSHPLKNLPDYKNAARHKKCPAPDLRHLFPYDPDVHAPFINSYTNNDEI